MINTILSVVIIVSAIVVVGYQLYCYRWVDRFLQLRKRLDFDKGVAR